MGIQQIISIGALSLFTYSILTFTTSSNVQYDASYYNEAVAIAISIGESMQEEIQKRAFDENTIDASLASADSLTSKENIGNDTYENITTTFDDIDDYDNYTKTESHKLGEFDISVSVYYVTIANPETESSSPTFLKRIDVSVSNSYLAIAEGSSETLMFSGLRSY